MIRNLVIISILSVFSSIALAQIKVVVIPLPGEDTNWEGPWAIDQNYGKGAVVQDGGSSYLSLKAHTSDLTNIPPTEEFWNLVAEKGSTGPAGPQGNTGPQGDAGPMGLPGENGSDGATGAAGEDGKDGNAGTPGANGDDGAPGPQGQAGAPGFILGRSTQTSDGRFTFTDFNGIRAADAMCKATYSGEATAHLCSHAEVQNSLSTGQYSRPTNFNNVNTWTITHDTIGAFFSGSSPNSCWNLGYNSGDSARGTRLTVYLNNLTPGNGGGIVVDRYDLRSDIACNSPYPVLCCR